jgi:hypothetical protein
MKIRISIIGIFLSVISGIIGPAAALCGPIQSGLLLNLEAANNTRHSDPVTRWTNLADPATYLSKEPIGNPGALVFGSDPDNTAFYSASESQGSTGGSLGRVSVETGGSGRVAEPNLFLESFSVEIWLRRLGNQAHGNEHQVWGLRSALHNQSIGAGLVFRGDTSWDTWQFNLRGAGLSSVIHLSSVSIPSDGKFHQYVVTWNDPSRKLSVHVDGSATAVWSVTSPGQDYSPSEDMSMISVFKIFSPEPENRRFNGDISVFRVYNRVLSTGDIAANFENGPSVWQERQVSPVAPVWEAEQRERKPEMDGIFFAAGLRATEHPRHRRQLEDPGIYLPEEGLGDSISEHEATVDERGGLGFHKDRTLFARGYLHVQEAGEYAFTVYGHHTGGARLVIGGVEIKQEETQNGSVATFLDLQTGLVPIQVVGRIGNGMVTIKWIPPGSPELVGIPQSVLFHGPVVEGRKPTRRWFAPSTDSLETKSSVDTVKGQLHPGLIARIYMGQPSGSPTHLVGIVTSSADYHARFRRTAEASMRGIYESADAQYVAHGFIVLEKDIDVIFDLQNCHCEVDGKVIWRKGSITQEQFSHRLTKGNHTIRLLRADYGQPGPEFSIRPVGADENILYHTEVQFESELGEEFTIDGKTYDTVLLQKHRSLDVQPAGKHRFP